MKCSMKLYRKGFNETPPVHFERCVAEIKRVLEAGHRGRPNVSEDDVYAEKYLAYNINRKACVGPDSSSDEEKEQAALKQFLLRETVNQRINQEETWGYDQATGEFEPSGDLGLELAIRAREILHELLGPAPDLRRVLNAAAFGNGASVSLRRSEAQAQNKFVRGLATTSGLAPFIPRLVGESPIWLDVIDLPKADVMAVAADGKVLIHDWRLLKRVAGGIMRFVEKQFDRKRIIVLEPDFNGYLQKGLGRCFREKLAIPSRWCRNGMNLNTSGDLNCELAKAGSADGHVATVDGEQASDSITISACEFYLPTDWFDLCMLLRSPYVVLPSGKLHRLQMMSGMGNGFTFELESAIFYAIGLACSERSDIPFASEFVSIHGDDLIVPFDVFDYVHLVYQKTGVVINTEKSFFEGPFRESCGGHFYNGQSVKPFFRRESTGRSRGDWFWLANSLLNWLSERNASYLQYGRGKELLHICEYLRWYASSGDPKRWYTSWQQSSRSGLYAEPPLTRGAWWKTRGVVAIERSKILPDERAYIGWLHTPVISPTVLEILKRDNSRGRVYETPVETDERERNVTLTEWPPLLTSRCMSSLWTYIVSRETGS